VSLKTFPEGIRLMQKPVGKSGTKVEMSPGQASWKLTSKDGAYTSIGYDSARHEIYVDRTHSSVTDFSKDFPARTAAPYVAADTPLKFEILVDRNSVEVFAADGRIVLTNLVFSPFPSKLIR
jgi:sucrose-6-phosphate hydrolase SacC (GH32 family)